MNRRQMPVHAAISEVNQLKVSRSYFRHPLNLNSNPPTVGANQDDGDSTEEGKGECLS